jgi:hypothetical protein
VPQLEVCPREREEAAAADGGARVELSGVHAVEPCLDSLLGVDGSVGRGGGGGVLLGCHCCWMVWMLCGYGVEGSSSSVDGEEVEIWWDLVCYVWKADGSSCG